MSKKNSKKNHQKMRNTAMAREEEEAAKKAARAAKRAAQVAEAAGMDGSLSKPFYPATLRNTLLQVRQGTYKGFEGEMTCPGDNLPAH